MTVLHLDMSENGYSAEDVIAVLPVPRLKRGAGFYGPSLVSLQSRRRDLRGHLIHINSGSTLPSVLRKFLQRSVAGGKSGGSDHWPVYLPKLWLVGR